MILASFTMARVAARISSSDAVKVPSTCLEQMLNVRSPTAEVMSPSAMDAGAGTLTTLFAFRAAVSLGAPLGSTP